MNHRHAAAPIPPSYGSPSSRRPRRSPSCLTRPPQTGGTGSLQARIGDSGPPDMMTYPSDRAEQPIGGA